MNLAKSKPQIAARLSLGLIFTVFGLNGFLHFIPQPPLSGPAAEFLGGLAVSGYFFPLLKGTEVAAGVLLLLGRFVPLALVVLAPIVLNAVAFHLFLAPAGIAPALASLVLGLYLAWTERTAFAPLFAARQSTRASRAPAGAHAASTA